MALRERGTGDQTEFWISICSCHRDYNDSCSMCRAGYWKNAKQGECEHQVYKLNYKLWHRIVNQPNSPSRLFLEETFPRLRGDHPALDPDEVMQVDWCALAESLQQHRNPLIRLWNWLFNRPSYPDPDRHHPAAENEKPPA